MEENLYEKVKALARERGKSISRLESEAGLGNGTISGWETSSPKLSNLRKIADALSVPLETLIS